MNKKNTRQHILDTAIKIFAKNGYSGTTMDNIAEIADVNKAAIYYHVGNKNRLYSAVLADFIKENRELMKKNFSLNENSKTNIANILKLLNNSSDTQKAGFRIMLREISSGWATLPSEVFADISSIFMQMRGILDSSIKSGELNEKDSLITHIFLFSSILLLNDMPKIRKKLIESGHFPSINEYSHEEEIDNYIDVIINGLFKK